MIKNKTFVGNTTYRKFYCYVWVEWKYLLWRLFKKKEETIFMDNCQIIGFNVKKWEVFFFWLARYIYQKFLEQQNDKTGTNYKVATTANVLVTAFFLGMESGAMVPEVHSG